VKLELEEEEEVQEELLEEEEEEVNLQDGEIEKY
jgi:hypothetical protein